MSNQKLKTVLLGLNESGRLLLEAANATELFEIEAVADKDINLVEKVASELNCDAYDDFRQLITTTEAKLKDEKIALLVAEDTHSCDEYIKMAMKKSFNVLKLPPAARDFEEASEFVRLSQEQKIVFTIANTLRYADSFRVLREYLENGKLQQIFMMTIFSTFNEPPYDSWHPDPKLAGGGVLLHNCYKIIDQIVRNFDIPQQVYSLQTNQAKDKQQRSYLTEDTAVITLKFSDTLIGNIIASRRSGLGSEQQYLRFFGQDKILTINEKMLNIRDNQGEIIEFQEFYDTELDRMTRLLHDFANSILFPQEYKPVCTGKQNLDNMAVIESAYLSARTGFPEEPARILQMPSGVAGI